MRSEIPESRPLMAAPSNRWIISPLGDALFVIGTPVLILAVLLPVYWTIPEAQFPLILVGVFSIGHHLPGFLRVYGDRELFGRYRFRALVLPPLLFAGVFWLTQHQLDSVLMLTLFWGFWHAMMQTYGFMRIYDAKRGRTDRLTARLDWWMCASCFLAMLLWSPSSARKFIDVGESSGLLYVSAVFADPVRTLALGAAAAVAVVYVLYTLVSSFRGRPVSGAKLLLLTVTAGFLYLSWILFETNPWLGLGAFELFHDIQYFTIVWGYNRRLAQRDSASRLLRWLFRPHWWLLGLYVTLVCGYGSTQFLPSPVTEQVLPSIFLTSALLHYYFDGFIWKVRQTKTQRDLGIDRAVAEASLQSTPGRSVPWLADVSHAFFIAAPLVTLAVLEVNQLRWELPMRESLVRLMPGSARYHCDLGRAYERRGRVAEAAAQYREALARDFQQGTAHYRLGLMLSQQGDAQAAAASFGRALKCDLSESTAALAIAQLLVLQKQPTRAVGALREAAQNADVDAEVYDMLARMLLADPSAADPAVPAKHEQDRAGSEATYWARRACEQTAYRDPHYAYTLASAYAADGDFARASSTLRTAEQRARWLGNGELTRQMDRAPPRIEGQAAAGPSTPNG